MKYLTDREWYSPTYEAPRFHEAEGDEDAECVWCGEPGADDEFGAHRIAVHSNCIEDYHRSVAPEDFCPECGGYNGDHIENCREDT